MEDNIIAILIAGAIGSLVKDILEDGKLTLPKIKDGNFYLGFLGGLVSGAACGALIDGSLTTAFMGGYTGSSVFGKILSKDTKEKKEGGETIKELIEKICKEESVDSTLALKVARCESSLNPTAVNINTTGSKDRGLYQINDKWHPEVTEDQAFDPEFSIRFFCKAMKGGNISWWNASRTCWEK